MERTKFNRELSETNFRSITKGTRRLRLFDSEALMIEVQSVKDLIPKEIFERMQELAISLQCSDESFYDMSEDCDCCAPYYETIYEKYDVLIEFQNPKSTIQYTGPIREIEDNPIIMEALKTGESQEYPTNAIGDLDSLLCHDRHCDFVDYYRKARLEPFVLEHCYVTITKNGTLPKSKCFPYPV